MCDRCTHDNTVLDALFRMLGGMAAEQRNIGISLAGVMLCEATAAERGRNKPEDVAAMHIASSLVQQTTPTQRNEAIHFLSMLKTIVTVAGNTLGLAKHALGDADAETIAPGWAPLAEKLKAMDATAAADPLAQMFKDPLGGKRPDNPRWN
jgi:hypothetical protein